MTLDWKPLRGNVIKLLQYNSKAKLQWRHYPEKDDTIWIIFLHQLPVKVCWCGANKPEAWFVFRWCWGSIVVYSRLHIIFPLYLIHAVYQCTTSRSVPNKHSNNEKQWRPQLNCVLVALEKKKKKRALFMGNKYQISCKPGTSWLTVHPFDLFYLYCIFSNRCSHCISPAFHFMPICKVWLHPQEAQVLAGREKHWVTVERNKGLTAAGHTI